VTDDDFAATVAVSVTTLPEVTVETGFPAAVNAKLVVVVAAVDWIVRERLVVAVSEPYVPVMVTEFVPRVADLLAVSVSTLVEVVRFGLQDAVTPLGNPTVPRLT